MKWPMSVIGQLCLWLGFLVATFAAVMRLEAPERPRWQTVPWPMYLLGLGLGTMGIVLVRQVRLAERTGTATGVSRVTRLRSISEQLHHHVLRLRSQLDATSASEIPAEFDAQVAPLLAEFVEAREVIIHRYGLKVYAMVMSAFASGERFLNRAWCAAVDSYVDETRLCLEAAEQRFLELVRLLENLESRSPDKM